MQSSTGESIRIWRCVGLEDRLWKFLVWGSRGILRWTALWGKRFVRRVTWRGQTGSSIAGASREVQAHMASIGTSILPGSEEQ